MAFLQSPQNAVSNGIAIESDIGVGGILDPAKVVPTGVVEDLLPLHAHQRSNQPPGTQTAFGWHAPRFAPGEQLPYPGFRLVVAVMPECEYITRGQQFTEGRIARCAGRLFTVAVRIHVDGTRLELHAELLCNRRAVPDPVRGRGI